MEPKISLITLGVRNLEASVTFYRDGLGLPTSGIQGDVAFFQLRGAWLSLYSRHELAADANIPDDGGGFAGMALAHNVPSKEDVDAVMAQAQRAGAVVTDPAQDRVWGGYSGYFKDPDGFLWEIAWNPYFDI